MTPSASAANAQAAVSVISYRVSAIGERKTENPDEHEHEQEYEQEHRRCFPRLLAMCPLLRGRSRPRNQTEFVVLLEMRMGGKDADAEAVSAGFTGGNRAAI
jgi:hypothetical protein